jgi:hypothetical protein
MYGSYSDCEWHTLIVDETGAIIWDGEDLAPLVKVNIPQQYRPIYNTPEGTKMLLSHEDGSAHVYDLPCELSTSIDKVLEEGSTLNISPNPTFYNATITYELPQHISAAELILMDMQGGVIRSYDIDSSFDQILIDTQTVAPGTYIYSIVSGGEFLVSKQVIFLRE